MSVDLPTPDMPSRATVCAGCRYGDSTDRPSSASALTDTTSTWGSRARIAAHSLSGSSLRSDLLRTTTGTAPASHTIVR